MPTTSNNPNRIINDRSFYGTDDDRRYQVTGRACTVCHQHGQEHRLINSRSRGTTMHTICVECERRRNRERRENGARAPRITVGRALGLNRRFGVEIECNLRGGYHGAAWSQLQRAFEAAGLSSWRIGSDGSLGASGIEVRSPILQGQNGLDQLNTAMRLLREAGATVDRRCGLHVHHEVRDIGRDGLVHFIRSWAANQNLIDWLVSPSRRNGANSYCQPWRDADLRGLDRMDERGHGLPGARYKTANAQSFARYGTVEIRQHQGTLSFRKVEAWIQLVQAMLDSVAGRGRGFAQQGSLSSLFSTASVDEDAAAFLLGRAVQFGAPATAMARAA